MDFLKKGLDMYEKSQENVSKTGGAEYNRPAHDQYGSSSGGRASPDFDESHAMHTAQQSSIGDKSLFSGAMSFINNNQGAKHESVDEEQAVRAHKVAYEDGAASNLSASEMGSAAAMKALKSFMGGGGASASSEKDQTSALLSMAVAEAEKLFNQSGGTASGGKQDVVNSAAMTAMKFMVQSKMSSMMGGGSSGGLSGLMSLASKFA